MHSTTVDRPTPHTVTFCFRLLPFSSPLPRSYLPRPTTTRPGLCSQRTCFWPCSQPLEAHPSIWFIPQRKGQTLSEKRMALGEHADSPRGWLQSSGTVQLSHPGALLRHCPPWRTCGLSTLLQARLVQQETRRHCSKPQNVSICPSPPKPPCSGTPLHEFQKRRPCPSSALRLLSLMPL